jgi:hypothetical protein
MQNLNLLDALKNSNIRVINSDILEGIKTSDNIRSWEGEFPLEMTATVSGDGCVNLESLEQGGVFTVASHWSGSPRATCPCSKYEMWINNPYWGKDNGRLINRS